MEAYLMACGMVFNVLLGVGLIFGIISAIFWFADLKEKLEDVIKKTST